MTAKYGNAASTPAPSLVSQARSFQPSMVTTFRTTIADREKSSKDKTTRPRAYARRRSTSPPRRRRGVPATARVAVAPSSEACAGGGHAPFGVAPFGVAPFGVAASPAETHRPVSLPANAIVPDTDATSMNQHRKTSASRSSGMAVSVVRISNCPSRKFFIARSGRKHRTARMAMNCEPVSVKRLLTVPQTSAKSNWFHPEARYASAAHPKPWSTIFSAASSANNAVLAFSNAAAASARGASFDMSSLAIDAVLPKITRNTNTSNQAAEAVVGPRVSGFFGGREKRF